ncbi:MAG: GNAT family N-acetyltransferase [Pseudomonadota bacterium]
MTIRLYRDDDLTVLHAANQASVPGVSTETLDDLALWIDMATCLVATDADDTALGFVTVMPLGLSAYPSPNMRWFETYADATGKAVVYVDRIALLPEARGKRLGDALYRTVFDHFSGLDEIGCEVNTLPPNPGSHRFHQRLGFREVGTQTFVPGEKSVTYYARPLT